MTGRALRLFLINELRGAAVVVLCYFSKPDPAVVALTALAGLTLIWTLAWREFVLPELIARERARILADFRPVSA